MSCWFKGEEEKLWPIFLLYSTACELWTNHLGLWWKGLQAIECLSAEVLKNIS